MIGAHFSISDETTVLRSFGVPPATSMPRFSNSYAMFINVSEALSHAGRPDEHATGSPATASRSVRGAQND
jgi:hypothetical protein